MRVNDDGKNSWSQWRELSLGKSGDQIHVINRKCNGIYVTRQYEFVYTGTGDFEMINPLEEDITVLR